MRVNVDSESHFYSVHISVRTVCREAGLRERCVTHTSTERLIRDGMLVEPVTKQAFRDQAEHMRQAAVQSPDMKSHCLRAVLSKAQRYHKARCKARLAGV